MSRQASINDLLQALPIPATRQLCDNNKFLFQYDDVIIYDRKKDSQTRKERKVTIKNIWLMFFTS